MSQTSFKKIAEEKIQPKDFSFDTFVLIGVSFFFQSGISSSRARVSNTLPLSIWPLLQLLEKIYFRELQ